MGRLTYRHTFAAACTGYIVQAVVNNLSPLLFIAFQTQFAFSRLQITGLITVNFCIQLLVDLASAGFVDRMGYRAAAVLSQVLAAAGLAGMGILPYVFADPYAGLLTAVVFSALGGGLLEVIISPIVEALPTEGKSSHMSLLHSFYCWGCVAVIGLSTLYFTVFGLERWRWLTLAWALLPAANLVFFLKVPLYTLLAPEETPAPLSRLLHNGAFWVMLCLMLCAGASEQAMSQWASLFAETGLGVSKTMGDLLGPCLFAVLMGTGRAWFGARERAIPLEASLRGSALLCVAAYLLTVFSPWPLMSLLGCGLCGLSVAVMWPGVFSLTSREFTRGGTAMFAILALAGDFGCSFGPTVVGFVSSRANGELRPGLLAAMVFPLAMALLLTFYRRARRAGGEVDNRPAES